MNIDSHLYPSYPKKIVDFRGLQSFAPRNLAFEAEAVQGAGCGFGSQLCKSAIGEFIERRHFFSDVPIDVVGKIHEHNSKSVSDALYFTINQLKHCKEDPESFDFQLVKVENFFDSSIAYLPRRLISLGKISPAEESFIPMMDSCGIAVHSSAKQSLTTSLNEFIERQALISSWIGDQQIPQYKSEMILGIKPLKRLAEQLLANGEVSVFDISGHLPGYTIAICYFARSNQDNAQYTIGVSSHACFDTALESALTELWQDYIYIYCYKVDIATVDPKDLMKFSGDTYHINHLMDNAQSTKSTIPFYRRSQLVDISKVTKKDWQFDQVRRQLENFSNLIFKYTNEDKRNNLFYTRVLSPDFYLHMGIDQSLNFDNKFAQNMKIDTQIKNYQRIPFP